MFKIATLIFTAFLVSGCFDETPQEQKALYNAWVKAYACSSANLTQSEWQLLRDSYLLPGQEAHEAKVAAQNAAAMSGLAVGMSAGVAASKR